MRYNPESSSSLDTPMTHLTIALPKAAKDYIDQQVSSGMYSTADEFLTALIEQEQERQAKLKVNGMIRSTLQSIFLMQHDKLLQHWPECREWVNAMKAQKKIL
jgi:Arc/MetJ-type ribon-helix-helix transcriptional regulator